MIYLAQPFKHKDHQIEVARYGFAVAYVAAEHKRGKMMYSPIVHSYWLNQSFDDGPKDFDFWREFDFNMLSKANYMYVLPLEGWKESVGVKAEIDFANAVGIPYSVISLTYDTLHKEFGLKTEYEAKPLG